MVRHGLNMNQWCYLHFRFATDARSILTARLRPVEVWTPFVPTYYEFVDEWCQRVHSRPDQALCLRRDRAGLA